jgi:two-component system cell cycle sensor histidine kinase/response regulator CckA
VPADRPLTDAVLAALPAAVVVIDAAGVIVLANPAAEARLGSGAVGTEAQGLVPARAIALEAALEHDGRSLRLLVLRERGDVLRQQAAIAELGQRALTGEDLRQLMQETARRLADVLTIDMVEVLELLPGREQFAMRGQVGWDELHLVPVAETHSGLTLSARGPVIVHDTATETRFNTVSFLREDHGVISGLAVPMIVSGRELGAVAVHSRHAREFSEDEVYFVQSAANVVAAAMERRRAEEELEQSSARLRAVIDASPAVIYLKDLEGRLTLANRRFDELFEIEPGSSVGELNASLLDAGAATIVTANDDAVIAAGAPMEFEERLPMGDGSTRIFISLKFPLRDAAGRVQGVGGVSTDVTERAALEARLARAERLETVGQLAGGIAHDFNNLLAVIANYAGFLHATVEPGSRAAEDVEQILAASRAANELTRRLLLFSRRRAGNPEVIDLTAVIADTEQLLERALGEQVELRTTVEPELWSVRADRAQLEQVLMNLAINARDAMPDGGVLTIEASNVALGRGEAAGVEGDAVCLAVSDTGSGMPEEVLDRAFEPFFSTKSAAEGRGLGLATVYGIVRGADGHIELHSRPGEGTEVLVHLPASRESAPAGAVGETSAAADAAGECVLLVEDKEAVRVLTSRILADAGYEVRSAADGIAALEEYGDDVDVLVSDIVMPGISGQELADQLRSRRPGLPVVFVSGYTEDHVVEDARRDGATAFVEKPFNAQELLRAVRAVLEER